MFAELLQTSTLFQVLVQYLSGARSTEELEEWLIGNLQGFLDSGDNSAIELANQIDALLVEMNEGLISESQLRENISTILTRRGTSLTPDSSASTNEVIYSDPIVLAPSMFLQVKHSFASSEVGK